MIKRSLNGINDECGDTGMVKVCDDQCFIALIDALGHGRQARDAAALAEAYLLDRYKQNLTGIIKGLHAHLGGTRGAVAAIGRLHLKTGVLTYAGVGNISIKIFGSSPKRLVTREGILGYMIAAPAENRIKLYPGDILILSSDGVREHFDLADFPGILTGNARKISAAFIDNLGKANDDASCITLRYGI